MKKGSIFSKWKKGDLIDGRYEVLDVKAGGMGIVYICYDRGFKKQVALKTLQDKYFVSPSMTARFMWEAETWVRLEKHPNIVQAYYVNRMEERPFICLEYIEGNEKFGAELKGWIRKGGLDLPTTLNFAIQFCTGMVHASDKFKEMRRPFVYRDVKPSNIMVTSQKVVKITDFGLVKLSLGSPTGGKPDGGDNSGDDNPAATKTGTVMGTPFYMSPEQWLGRNTDERADIYAFGCVLYEMLTGVPPFKGKDTEDLRDLHIKAPVKEIPYLPKVLNEIIARCLKKNPGNRYTDFAELRGILSSVYQSFTGQLVAGEEKSDILKAWELVNKGISLFNLKYYDEAIKCFGLALRIKPDYAEALRNRGSAYHALGLIDRAIDDYREAIKLKPDYPEVYYNRGTSYFAIDNVKQAIKDYDTAIKLNPDYAEAYYNRAVAKRKLLATDEAIADYTRAIELKPAYARAYRGRGNAFYSTGRFEEAIADYESAMGIDPNSPEVCFNLALACQQHCDNEKAITYWKKFIGLAEKDPNQMERVPVATNNLELLEGG